MQKVKDVRAAFAELRSKLEKLTPIKYGEEAKRLFSVKLDSVFEVYKLEDAGYGW